MNLVEAIRSRRTVGSFRPDAPAREIVLRAIELACWAPNHKKTEPWRFCLIGPETSARIVELNASIVAAASGPEAAETKRRQWSAVPGWLAVTCLKNDDVLLQEEDYAAVCCAIQNLSLALWDEGIGTKWSTGAVTRHPEYLPLLGIDPARERTVGLLWYGYPAVVPSQSRRSVAEVLRELP